MDPKYDKDDFSELDATSRFRAIADRTETDNHRYSKALADAVGEIGDKLKSLNNVVSGIQITQSRHVNREEVKTIAMEANGKLEGQVDTLSKLVFGVLIAIPIALIVDIFVTNHK